MSEPTGEQLAEWEALAQAATEGPWEHGDRYNVAGVLRERFGDNRCGYCGPSKPVWVGVTDINGRQMVAHVHETDEPWWPHGIVAALSGDRLPCQVVTETDEYGLMSQPDAAFIAAAREAVPALVRALRDARDENDRMASVLSDVFCEQTGGRLSYPTYDARTVNAEINDARQQEIDVIETERDSLRERLAAVERRHSKLRSALSCVHMDLTGRTVAAADVIKILDADASAADPSRSPSLPAEQEQQQ